MSSKMIPFFMLCETPLHVGVGSDVGIVDMPIQRERHTGWPKIDASGIKGSIRQSFENKYKSNKDKMIDIHVVFGYDDGEKDTKVREHFKEDKQFAGALGFSDARILLFPVKSFKGVFGWVTCPAVLNRFFIDLSLSNIQLPKFNIIKNTINPESNCIVKKHELGHKIILEEFNIVVDENESCKEIGKWLGTNILPNDEIYKYLKEKLEKDIIILSDDEFGEFVSLSTEVITRTKIDNESGTVKGGALFTEEYLPSETFMYAFAIASPTFSKVDSSFRDEEYTIGKFFEDGLNETIQIGGNANLGKGIVSTKILEVR